MGGRREAGKALGQGSGLGLAAAVTGRARRPGSEDLLSNNDYYVSNCCFIEGCVVLSCVSHSFFKQPSKVGFFFFPNSFIKT